jgi:hypothetical protein
MGTWSLWGREERGLYKIEDSKFKIQDSRLKVESSTFSFLLRIICMLTKFKTYLQLMNYSGRLMAGKRFWIIIFLPLIWPVLQALFVGMGWSDSKFNPADAHLLISIPLSVVAMGLGLRIIAGEIDSMTLEIAYTVPGGCHRVWLAKIATCFCLLLASELLLALLQCSFLYLFQLGHSMGRSRPPCFILFWAWGFQPFSGAR